MSGGNAAEGGDAVEQLTPHHTSSPESSGNPPSCYHPGPVYYNSPCSEQNHDSQSLSSQDSGIPTLEINPPVPALFSQRQPADGASSPATLPLDDEPSDPSAIHRSSTFPRCGYESFRLYSPSFRASAPSGMSAAGGVLNRSDDISVCSMSSMSTELSVSNEDILDFTVTSNSSAIVTLETDNSGTSHFSDVTLSSSPGRRDLWSPLRPHPSSDVAQQEVDGRQKKLGPLAGLFNRSVQNIRMGNVSHTAPLISFAFMFCQF